MMRVAASRGVFSRAFSSAAKESLVIFDTTLRDGEQSPGATLNIKEKIEIATMLSRMGVDVCEAGFPIASVGDFEVRFPLYVSVVISRCEVLFGNSLLIRLNIICILRYLSCACVLSLGRPLYNRSRLMFVRVFCSIQTQAFLFVYMRRKARYF
jgi:hypothetical protein